MMASNYQYEMDCECCDEGILQWTDRDEIAICDCCDNEINLNDLCERHWELCFVE